MRAHPLIPALLGLVLGPVAQADPPIPSLGVIEGSAAPAPEPAEVRLQIESPLAGSLVESRLHMARGVGPVVSVTQAGAEIEPVCRRGSECCLGQIAVFHDGTLRALGTAHGSVTLGKVRAGERVDLGKLARRAKVNRASEVQLLGVDRRPVGEWPIRR